VLHCFLNQQLESLISDLENGGTTVLGVNSRKRKGCLLGPNPSANLVGLLRGGQEPLSGGFVYFMDSVLQCNSTQRLRQCWHDLESLTGSSCSMLVRPRVFHVVYVEKDCIVVRTGSGRVRYIPNALLRAVLIQLFACSRISLHEVSARHSKEYAEFVFGILARLPGLRLDSSGTGLSLVLDAA
jgi:hypothetical protein